MNLDEISITKKKLQDSSVILLRLPNWVGDIVMTIPSLLNLKTTYKNHRFIGTGKEFCPDILKGLNVFDDFIIKPQRSEGASLYFHYLQKLRHLENAAAILFTNSFSSALDMFLASIPIRIGYKNEFRDLFLTQTLPLSKAPMNQFYQNLVKNCGCDILHEELYMPLDEECIRIFNIVEKKYAILDDEIFVGLNPGAGFGETKKWLPEHFVTLAKLLLEKYPNLRFFVFGGPGDEHRAEFISEQIGSPAINLSKECLGLHNIKPFFDRMALFVTNDSGLRWYAIAMKKPTVVLFGSSDPALTNCFTQNFYPLRLDLPCSPCKNRVCPTDFACMKNLSPNLVSEKILTLAKQSPLFHPTE